MTLKPLPEWLFNRYAKVFDKYRDTSWTLADAVSIWHDTVPRANVVISMLRNRGHAIFLKREERTRYYRLISPEDFLFSSLHLPSLVQVQAEPYKPIIIKTIQSLRNQFDSRLTAVGLFGSAARGDISKTSDVDLYVVAEWSSDQLSDRFDEYFPCLDAIKNERDIMWRNGIATDVSIYPASRNEACRFQPFLLDFTHDGIALYDPENFLQDTWKRLKVWLTHKKIRRFETPHTWYWRLNPNIEVGSNF